jgi:hypothetical protein
MGGFNLRSTVSMREPPSMIRLLFFAMGMLPGGMAVFQT